MKVYEILVEATAGKQALDYKRSNRYPDGTSIPDSLPPRYQLASNPGVPANQKCSNCGYYDTKTKKCDKFKGDPVVKPAYWCLKWEPMEEEVTEGVAGPKSCWPGYRKTGTQPGTGKNKGKRVNDCEKIKEDNVEEDWNKVNKKDKTDGLSQKAVNAYRRENPGSKLKTAVTTKPSKLKAGSKDAKRRKSFCARMSGNKGPMKKPNGEPTPKALALRRWNCESVEHMVDLIIENMDHAKDNRAVPELKAALIAQKTKLQKASDEDVYDIIDTIMTRIAKTHGISGQKLHDMWVDQYDQVPDTWIMK